MTVPNFREIQMLFRLVWRQLTMCVCTCVIGTDTQRLWTDAQCLALDDFTVWRLRQVRNLHPPLGLVQLKLILNEVLGSLCNCGQRFRLLDKWVSLLVFASLFLVLLHPHRQQNLSMLLK